jgi:hypothetical protein
MSPSAVRAKHPVVVVGGGDDGKDKEDDYKPSDKSEGKPTTKQSGSTVTERSAAIVRQREVLRVGVAVADDHVLASRPWRHGSEQGVERVEVGLAKDARELAQRGTRRPPRTFARVTSILRDVLISAFCAEDARCADFRTVALRAMPQLARTRRPRPAPGPCAPTSRRV